MIKKRVKQIRKLAIDEAQKHYKRKDKNGYNARLFKNIYRQMKRLYTRKQLFIKP